MWNEPTTSPPIWTARPSSSTRLLDAPAGPVARLEQLDVGAGRGEVARGREAGQAGAEDEHVAHQRSTWPCSGRQPDAHAVAQLPAVVGARARGVLLERDEPRAGRQLDDQLRRGAHVDALGDHALDRRHAVLELVDQSFSGRTESCTSVPSGRPSGTGAGTSAPVASRTPPFSTVAGSRFEMPMKPATNALTGLLVDLLGRAELLDHAVAA